MLKKRVIATLIMRENKIVQSRKFGNYLPIGKPEIAVEFLNDWGVDEIILLDISATLEKRLINIDLIKKISSYCQIPLAIGGGIKTIDDIRNILSAGGDKVVINSKIKNDLSFLTEASKIFGKQCLVSSIDIIKKDNDWYSYDYKNKTTSNETLKKLVLKFQKYGCGEIFINSVDRDGTYNGLDMEALETIEKDIYTPIIFCGGIGTPAHFLEGLSNRSISAVAAANYYFQDKCGNSKNILQKLELEMRHYSIIKNLI